MKVPTVMIENQAKIEENINKCEELATATNEREILTEEVYHKMRSYQVGIGTWGLFSK